MRRIFPILLVAAVACLAPLPAVADGRNDALNLDQHASPDVSAQDRYKDSVARAEDALKKNLAHCDKLQTSERAECVRQAQALHDADIAKAGDVLARPPQ